MKKEKIKVGPSTYSTEILSGLKFHRTLPANLNRAKAEKFEKAKRDNVPGPHHYVEKEKNYERNVADRSVSPSFTCMKEKNNRFVDRVIKDKSWLPAPNHYNKKGSITAVEAQKKLHIGPSSITRKRS